jgi:hypothetical protein
MQAQKITQSKRKLEAWADTRALDLRAKAIAEREGIPLVAAYAIAVREDDAR